MIRLTKQKRPTVSRRRFLEATAWAMPIAAAVGPLVGCSKAERAGANSDVLELGARNVVDKIAKRELSAESYMGQLLKQYAAHKDLNPIVSIDEARILEQARAVDKAIARGEKVGPAAGLPFGVKDQIAVAGYPATGGVGALKKYVPTKSAPVVDAVVKAGGIVFAKTHVPDMVGGTSNTAKMSGGNSQYFGNARNPYDPKRFPGGSSCGNGVVLGARIVPAAIGEDSGGSIRLPASFCGLAGLRPSTFTIEATMNGSSTKRWSDEGIIIPPAGPRDTFGPMARTVSDCAFLDDIVTGTSTPMLSLREFKLAVPSMEYWQQEFLDQGVAKVVQEAIAKLKDAGAQLVEVDYDAVRTIGGRDLNRALREDADRNEKLAKWLAANLPEVTVEEVTQGGKGYPIPGGEPPMDPNERKAILEDAAKQYADFFARTGAVAVVFPTIPIPPPLIRDGGETMDYMITLNGKSQNQNELIVRNIGAAPRFGAPGLNVPVGMTNGLPVGIELDGLPGDDKRVLAAGIAIQAAVGRLPPPTFQSNKT